MADSKKISRETKRLSLAPYEEVKERLEEQTGRLYISAKLLNELAALPAEDLARFPAESHQKALRAAAENYGYEAELYEAITGEFNVICDEDLLDPKRDKS